MITISVQLSEELAKRVLPVQDRLPEIIELGLECWRGQGPLTPRQRVERLWEASGLSMSPSPALPPRPSGTRQRSPLRAGGKPASEIIIEQRGAK